MIYVSETDRKVTCRKIWGKRNLPNSIWTILANKSRFFWLWAKQPLIASYGNVQVLNHPQQGCPMAPFRQSPALWSLPWSQWEFLPPRVQAGHRNWKCSFWRWNLPYRYCVSASPLHMSELESAEQGFSPIFQRWNMASAQRLEDWCAMDGQWEGHA